MERTPPPLHQVAGADLIPYGLIVLEKLDDLRLSLESRRAGCDPAVDPSAVSIVDQAQHLETRTAGTRPDITVPTADLLRVISWTAVLNREDVARGCTRCPRQPRIALG